MKKRGEIVYPYFAQDGSRFYPDGPGFNEKELGQDPMYAWSYHPNHAEQFGEGVKRGRVPEIIVNQVHGQLEILAKRAAHVEEHGKSINVLRSEERFPFNELESPSEESANEHMHHEDECLCDAFAGDSSVGLPNTLSSRYA